MTYTKEQYLKFVDFYEEQNKTFEVKIEWYKRQIDMNKRTIEEYKKRANKLLGRSRENNVKDV